MKPSFRRNRRLFYDDIMRLRGRVRGPFAVWLRNAELAEGALKLQELFASGVKMERRLIQLMILVAARYAGAQYAWYIHEPHALQHGIAREIVEAIRERRTPDFSHEDERLVYDITLELNTTHRLSDLDLRPRYGAVRRTADGRASLRRGLLRHGGDDAQRLRCRGPRRQEAVGVN